MSKKREHRYKFCPKRNLRDDIVVFIDRDGVINTEVHLLTKAEDFVLLSHVSNAIKKLNDANIPVIVVSNQTVVARGLCREEDVQRVHHKMMVELRKVGAHLDGIFYCAHSPEADVEAYRFDCPWRKPKPGMFKKALQLLGGKRRCFVIGDMGRDVRAGRAVGCTTLLVKTGHAGQDPLFPATPDYWADDLLAAVDVILANQGRPESLRERLRASRSDNNTSEYNE